MIGESDQPVCMSGGADGADLAWGLAARAVGHQVVHWEFRGHRSKALPDERYFLSDEQLLEADEALVTANRTLNRRWPLTNNFVASLLRRNFFQIRWSNALYAVSRFERGLVKGGTAWAVQMFVDRFEGRPAPCFVFDQAVGVWTEWDGEGFLEMDVAPPSPEGIYAAVGTRELNKAGQDAIDAIYQKQR